MHIQLFRKKRGHLTTRGSPIKYGDQILRLLEAGHLPTEVSVSHCEGHQKGTQKCHKGTKQLIRQQRAALQNHDLIGIATLVPQTNLPETPSYTEGETLKAKSEGFPDHIGWFQKEGLLFLPGNLQWKLVNSLHATSHLGEKALQRLLERSFRGTSFQRTVRQVVSSCPTCQLTPKELEDPSWPSPSIHLPDKRKERREKGGREKEREEGRKAAKTKTEVELVSSA